VVPTTCDEPYGIPEGDHGAVQAAWDPLDRDGVCALVGGPTDHHRSSRDERRSTGRRVAHAAEAFEGPVTPTVTLGGSGRARAPARAAATADRFAARPPAFPKTISSACIRELPLNSRPDDDQPLLRPVLAVTPYPWRRAPCRAGGKACP